jgi:uncharacterized protein with HEPN domain
MNEKPAKIDRLQHIVEAIDRILKFVDGMEYEHFLANEMAQFAVIKNFEIIGEAAYQLPKDYRMANEEKIEWRKIIAFRHILVHDYYKINTEIIWNAIHGKLVEMKGEVEELISME